MFYLTASPCEPATKPIKPKAAVVTAPAAAIQAFQGMLLFFLLAVDVMSNYRIRFLGKEMR